MKQSRYHKLQKTRRSLINHVARGNTVNAPRSWDLIDRYEELRNWMIENDPDFWASFCNSYHYDRKHNAYDYFA